MKKIFCTLVILLTAVINTNAMPYQQAREQALFLTDKMAYELNLNNEQYEAAYEINLDYLMDVTTVDDVYAASWRQRNIDLQYVLMDWQYNAFCAASYFFRPLYWNAGNWHFAVYAHYPHHEFFYFSRPTCYISYRGAHSWRYNGGRSWYMPRVDNFRRPGIVHVGMRDNYRPAPNARPSYRNDRPGYRNDNSRPNYRNDNRVNYRPNVNDRNNSGNRYDRNDGWRQDRDNSRNYNRESSTRKTVTNGNSPTTGNNRNNSYTPNRNNSYTPNRNNSNNGYSPSAPSRTPGFSSGTRAGGSTFRGNSTTSRPATGSAGIGRR